MAHETPPTTAVTAPTPLSQRKQGLLRALLIVVGFGGGGIGLTLAIGGLQAIKDDLHNGPQLTAIGVGMIVAAIVVPVVVKRFWGAALTATHDLAVALPFGAMRHRDGVKLRARAAVRIVPGILVAMLLLVVLGMSGDGVNPIAVWCVGALTVALRAFWLWIRRYEICMDSTGIWSRRRPKWRLAWPDLEGVETLATPKGSNVNRPDDLILHGLVARPGGKVTPSIRLRMNLLAISADDLQRLAEHFASGRLAA